MFLDAIRGRAERARPYPFGRVAPGVHAGAQRDRAALLIPAEIRYKDSLILRFPDPPPVRSLCTRGATRNL